MKHILLIAGLAAVGYVIYQRHQATMAGVAAGTFNGGVANTSGGGDAAAGTVAAIGGGGTFAPASPLLNVDDGMKHALPVDASSASPDAMMRSATHPLDFYAA